MTKQIKTAGPIATKLISDVRKAKTKKIIDLDAVRTAKALTDEVVQSNKNHDASRLDPLHAIYIAFQHCTAEFFEQFSTLPYSHEFCDWHEYADEFYMPSGPPMSPVTKSFYTGWLSFDMGVGVKKETITSIMIALYQSLSADEKFLEILSLMQTSYNGLYIHEGCDARYVYLRELYTGKLHKTLVPAGYNDMATLIRTRTVRHLLLLY